MNRSASRIAWAVGLALVTASITSCHPYDAALLDPASGPRRDAGADDEQPGVLCGNAVIDDGELCDIAIGAGEVGACPSDCETLDMCEPNLLTGKFCNAECKTARITTARNRDGCCPAGVGPAEDSDCGFCGDGVQGPDETCDPPGDCPAPESCVGGGNTCIVGRYVGDASQCTARCQQGVITECKNDDGCCPDGCSTTNDSECSNSCGNGVFEPDHAETCESGTEQPCPASCDDGIACTEDFTTGSAGNCSLLCAHVPVVDPLPDDGCCAPGANANSDPDCVSYCGNMIREPGETCDPCNNDCEDNDPCTVDQLDGDRDQCTAACGHTAVTARMGGDGCCPSGATSLDDSDCDTHCGNGVAESGEACDGEAWCNSACQRILHPSIVHRYRFNGTGVQVTDSAGNAHGSVVGDTLDGDGKLTLAGGTSETYVDLPNGIISQLVDGTFEAWVTWTNTDTDHVRIFDFGSGADGEGQQSTSSPGYLYLTGGYDSTRHPRASYSRDGTTTQPATWTGGQFPASGITHVAVVFNDSGNTMVLYLNGVSRATRALDSGDHLSSLTDNNNWLGRSQFLQDAEFAGAFHEFRIYSAALTPTEIQASYAAGPDP